MPPSSTNVSILDNMSPSDNGSILAEVTNAMASATVKDEAANQRSRDHGWVEPQKYDYESYNAGTREEREAIEQSHEVPAWASNAVKYEWSDEYGDVGPEHPLLEADLFQDQHRMQSGIEFDKYLPSLSPRLTCSIETLTRSFRLTEIAVTVESDAKIKPVAKVLLIKFALLSWLTVFSSSKTLDYIRLCSRTSSSAAIRFQLQSRLTVCHRS